MYDLTMLKAELIKIINQLKQKAYTKKVYTTNKFIIKFTFKN